MAKFINVRTGNVLCTDNAISIALMEKSDNYVPVTEDKKTGKRTGKK